MADGAEFNVALFVVVGLLVVFAALAIIVTAVSLFGRLDKRWRAREAQADEAAFGKEPTIDTTTLVLIAAAAATVTQGRFHITRIRRLLPVDGGTRTWSASGRAVLMGSHVVPRRR
ncbi:MAG TPA: OadG family transporter subunit [candidate division Zixibacteria bacterium]|nr:OadG family protein [candidate division Zixibacteria bacterium]MDD4916791.1 OadG family transporter subunit [candidate division Zixibacteria bacterium]MDM7972408.1 OadG family transporter subunit [candidate division Zixibacteria bacterium]HOD66130.1 OadG family transporter subunit [candidate division Zixibacteria bacterium]HPI33148.1 OadG family transporter subunit [candidate division Zixibacteria bacterium]